MGIFDIFRKAIAGESGDSGYKGPRQKCPNCNESVTLGMERCPKCGVRIKSMFRRKCPQCSTLNELDAKRCSNCKYDFEAELERAKKSYYICPICGYRSEALLTHCPACKTRFM
jgi:anaerobic ribonucleoside-triphosphate reductase